MIHLAFWGTSWPACRCRSLMYPAAASTYHAARARIAVSPPGHATPSPSTAQQVPKLDNSVPTRAPEPRKPLALTRRIPLRSHCRPNTRSSDPTASRNAPIGTSLSTVPSARTRRPERLSAGQAAPGYGNAGPPPARPARDSDRLLTLDEVVGALGMRGERSLGLQTIPLDTIVGTADSRRDFDRHFRPTSNRAQRAPGDPDSPAMDPRTALPRVPQPPQAYSTD
jgi:hypothetical protein